MEHAAKTWPSVCLMAPHLQSDKKVRPYCAWTNGIAQHQSEGD